MTFILGAVVQLGAGVIVPSAASSQEPSDTLACYHLTYDSPTSDSIDYYYAEFVALHTGGDPVARSGMGPGKDSIGFWRMFLTGGTWETHADSITIHFSNGFSGVVYQFADAGGDSLRGVAQVYSDVIVEGSAIPTVGVSAISLPCNSAYIQSPPYTLDESEMRRFDRRLSELMREEEQRIRSIAAPMAGTYRIEIQIAGADPLTLFGRTEARLYEPVWEEGEWNNQPRDTAAVRAIGGRLRTVVTRTEGELPSVGLSHDIRGKSATSSFVLLGDSASSGDSTVWRVRTSDLQAAARLIEDHDSLDSLLSYTSQLVHDVSYDGVPGRTIGSFVLTDSGDARYWMRVERLGSEVLFIRGWRVSNFVLERPEGG